MVKTLLNFQKHMIADDLCNFTKILSLVFFYLELSHQDTFPLQNHTFFSFQEPSKIYIKVFISYQFRKISFNLNFCVYREILKKCYIAYLVLYRVLTNRSLDLS